MANHHDTLFKAVFGQPAQARAVFAQLLPPGLLEHLVLDELRREPGDFTRAGQELRTDLLFSVPLTDGSLLHLYLLFEHQRTSDPRMAWRLLRYQMRILERFVAENPATLELPRVLCLVLYNGTRPWTAPLRLSEQLASQPDLGDLSLDFGYLVHDLSEGPLGKTFGDAATTLAALLLRSATEPGFLQVLQEHGESLRQLARQGGVEALWSHLDYIIGVSEQEPLPRVIQLVGGLLDPEDREVFMTWAERVRLEGVQIGRREGREEGREEGLRISLTALLIHRFGPLGDALRARIDAADAATLQQATLRVLDATSPEDVLDG